MVEGFIAGVVVFIIIALCFKFKVNPILIIFEVVGEFLSDFFGDFFD